MNLKQALTQAAQSAEDLRSFSAEFKDGKQRLAISVNVTGIHLIHSGEFHISTLELNINELKFLKNWLDENLL